MDRQTRLHFVKEKEDRRYVIDVPYGAPTGEAYDVCMEAISEIKSIMDKQLEKQEKESAGNQEQNSTD